MANSRFDNIRYFDTTFKIPGQIKVFDGSSWVDLGTKNSFNTKKLSVYNNNSYTCVTYARRDIDIPKTIQIGTEKYINLLKNDGSYLAIDNYHAGYYVDMTVEVYESTPLYTVYTRNTGDIKKQSYSNYIAQVQGNTVRLYIISNFTGNRITDGAYVDATTTGATDYVWSKGEKVRILISRASDGGKTNVKVYNMSGTQLCDTNISENTQWVGTPHYHRLGSETATKGGSQSVYGNTKIYSFKIHHPNLNATYDFNFTGAANGATIVQSSSSPAQAVASGTSVYGVTETVYDRQTI